MPLATLSLPVAEGRKRELAVAVEQLMLVIAGNSSPVLDVAVGGISPSARPSVRPVAPA